MTLQIPFDLQTNLSALTAKAIIWAEAQSIIIAETGRPLDDALLTAARNVGVVRSEQIRIAVVEHLPLPEDPDLKQAALAVGFLDPRMAGLTIDHGIFVCSGRMNTKLLLHEFRHVYQYEQAGSIAAFLPDYFRQIATFGYRDAPYEMDARVHEQVSVRLDRSFILHSRAEQCASKRARERAVLAANRTTS